MSRLTFIDGEVAETRIENSIGCRLCFECNTNLRLARLIDKWLIFSEGIRCEENDGVALCIKLNADFLLGVL
jgi:hypothetical protein